MCFWLSYTGIALTIFLPDYLLCGIEQMSVITYRILFLKLVYTGLIFFLIHLVVFLGFLVVSSPKGLRNMRFSVA